MMEYIIELGHDQQLAIPQTVVDNFDLKPGDHFTLRSENGRLIIEYLPFSSFDQAKTLDETISALKK